MPLLIVHTTVSSEADARRLAALAVARKLAACVQIEAIRSTYEWQGELVQEPEWRLLFKTAAAHYPALEALLAEHHPYEVPAIYALEAARVAAPFAAWVEGALAPLESQRSP